MIDLSVDLCGLKLRNPTMLAAGVLGETGKSMATVARAGAGAIVTKSIGKKPRSGHLNPCVVELPFGLLNAMGLPNPGAEAFGREIAEAREGGAPVIASVFGSTEEEFAELCGLMAKYGADAVELNLSCPHAHGYGAEIGSDPDTVQAICRKAKKRLRIPVLAKLTPDTTSIADLALAAQRGGADGIVAINTLKGMRILPEARMPVLANRVGGLSGPAIRPVGVRCVYEIFEAVKVPVVGVGGVSNASDALEYIMAGASSVQVGTAVWSEGPEVFSKITGGLMKFMAENGFNSVKEMVGIAHSSRP
ncbi:MAG: dihydroorotate dehydrogenase [Candidatus Thermoplasmatota archaeon]|nr:dihydroorotate dehydrogenase [Candidatus Thermoplasmatota archaeon]